MARKNNLLKKLAIFIEGYTELLFMDRLISEIGGEHKVIIEQRQIQGGGKSGLVPRTMTTIKAAKTGSDQRYLVLLLDCGGDLQVKTRILEEHANLTRDGYTKIIGIRDVRPKFSYSDVPQLEAGLRKYIKTSLIPVEFILSIMEIEAWFLAEFNHFPKIDPLITVEAIKNNLGFDPEHDDISLRPEPRADMEAAYAIGGKSYTKGTNATINALDYPYLYVSLPHKIPYLKRLGDCIDDFFS